MTNLPILYIVVPCYNEEPVLEETTNRLTQILTSLIELNKISEKSSILYVNDGSKDKTWDIIESYNKTRQYVSGVNLAKNVGHQNALMAGLTVAKENCDISISIDADLQDDVNAIKEMVELYHNGYDIVYGVRKKRTTDTFFKKWTALGFYKLMASMGVNSVYNHADYRLMSKRALEFLCQFRERNLFLRGMVPLIGYKTACVYYDRAERFAGESKYPLSKMLNFAIDGITSFSVKPVRLVFFLGILFLVIAFGISLYVLYSFIRNEVVPGWSSIMISIWFCSGCILLGLGIVGEYIGKIYIEIKDRPRYNIENII